MVNHNIYRFKSNRGMTGYSYRSVEPVGSSKTCIFRCWTILLPLFQPQLKSSHDIDDHELSPQFWTIRCFWIAQSFWKSFLLAHFLGNHRWCMLHQLLRQSNKPKLALIHYVKGRQPIKKNDLRCKRVVRSIWPFQSRHVHNFSFNVAGVLVTTSSC